MKLSLIVLSVLLNQNSAFSQIDCSNLEAQIVSKVERVETDSMTYCKAYISSQTISQYTESQVCPLSRRMTIYRGISFPLINGHDCEISEGDDLSGYLVYDGQLIYLD